MDYLLPDWVETPRADTLHIVEVARCSAVEIVDILSRESETGGLPILRVGAVDRVLPGTDKNLS